MTVSENARRSSVMAPVIIFLVALAVYLPTASRGSTSVDVFDSALASWRIADTGAPWLEDFDLDSLGKDTEQVERFIGTAANGHVVVNRSPGVIAASVPAYVLASSGTFSTTPQALTAGLLAALAVMLMYLALVTRLSPRIAAVATAVFGLTTPVWSVAADGMWPHTLTILGISGMAWAAATERWWLVGVFGSIALWGRVHVSIVVAVVGLGVAWSRRRPGVAVTVGAISAVGMLTAMVWTHWMYGRWSPTGGYQATDVMERVGTADGNSAWGQVTNEAGLFISPDRGLLCGPR